MGRKICQLEGSALTKQQREAGRDRRNAEYSWLLAWELEDSQREELWLSGGCTVLDIHHIAGGVLLMSLTQKEQQSSETSETFLGETGQGYHVNTLLENLRSVKLRRYL